jgi:enoyl-CoA hydratase/carnithine racemase
VAPTNIEEEKPLSVVLYEKKDRLVYITLNRPDVMNALSIEVRRKLIEAWQEFRDDDDAWVAIISGAGDRAFSAGADLKEMASLPPAQIADLWEGTPPVLGIRGIELWKPVIAAINGFCLAGGLELAMSCDMRVATENSTFGLAEVTRAIIPGAGGTQRLPRLMPLAIAMEMLLCGKRIDAQEAYRFGLINRIVPPGQHLAAAEEIARTILGNGPLAVRAIKESALRGLEMSLEDGFRLEGLLSRLIRDTEDAKEGPRAFAEKRPPAYRGR